LNSSYTNSARVFTIFHELTHLARGDQAVCGNPRNDELERWCERVAATILIPARDLLEYLDKRVTTRPITTVNECQRVAKRYNVSVRAAAVRIIELKRGSQRLYDLVDREIETGSDPG
jgi:Zn-dependent peptidase ImmA (M78 family)